MYYAFQDYSKNFIQDLFQALSKTNPRFKMSTCTVPANEPIYDALIIRASYLIAVQESATLYKEAAETVASLQFSLYTTSSLSALGFSPIIEQFINKVIKKDRSFSFWDYAPVTAPVTVTPNFYLPVTTGTAVPVTMTTPRRSKRLAEKPQINYYEGDTNDDVICTIKSYCDKNGYNYSSTLPTEFNAWVSQCHPYQRGTWDWSLGDFVPLPLPKVARFWVAEISEYIIPQKKQKDLVKYLIKQCENDNITYDDLMGMKFLAWMADPANKALVTYKTNPDNEHTPSYCAKKYLSTFKN